MADHFLLCLSLYLICLYSVFAGPTQIRVEQDNQKSFHVGPEARTTFELIEEYRPLSTAFNQLNRPRAHSSSLSKTPATGLRPQQAQILVDFADATIDNQHQGREEHAKNLPTPTFSNDSSASKPKHSHWLEWTRWSGCNNGQRVRLRQCLEVNNVKCQGENLQSQKCFSFQHSDIPFVKDPLVIEKEIRGGEPEEPIPV